MQKGEDVALGYSATPVARKITTPLGIFPRDLPLWFSFLQSHFKTRPGIPTPNKELFLTHCSARTFRTRESPLKLPTAMIWDSLKVSAGK